MDFVKAHMSRSKTNRVSIYSKKSDFFKARVQSEEELKISLHKFINFHEFPYMIGIN